MTNNTACGVCFSPISVYTCFFSQIEQVYLFFGSYPFGYKGYLVFTW